MGRHAYTLVEVLAVTVLLGVVATLGAPPLLRSITGDPLGQAAGRLAHAFRDARAQAYGHRISMRLEPWGFSGASIEDGIRTSLPTARLPESVQASWTRRGRSTNLLDLDARGHGPDTDVALRQDDREMIYTIDGLTGRWALKAPP